MSCQRDPNLYSLHVYGEVEDIVKMKTVCEGRLVPNKSKKTMRPMSLSHLASLLIKEGVKDIVPSKSALAWGETIRAKLAAQRKNQDEMTANGVYRSKEKIAERRRAVRRKAEGLTSRPRPIKAQGSIAASIPTEG